MPNSYLILYDFILNRKKRAKRFFEQTSNTFFVLECLWLYLVGPIPLLRKFLKNIHYNKNYSGLCKIFLCHRFLSSNCHVEFFRTVLGWWSVNILEKNLTRSRYDSKPWKIESYFEFSLLFHSRDWCFNRNISRKLEIVKVSFIPMYFLKRFSRQKCGMNFQWCFLLNMN